MIGIKKMGNFFTRIKRVLRFFIHRPLVLIFVLSSFFLSIFVINTKIINFKQTKITYTNSGIQPLSPPLNRIADEDSKDSSIEQFFPDESDDKKLHPISAYSLNFENTENKPTLSVVFASVGFDPEITTWIVDQFHENVALSFSPYASDAKELMKYARSKGHEVLLDMPIEPETHLMVDPGPLAISSKSTLEETAIQLKRLHKKGHEHLGYLMLYPSALQKDLSVFYALIDQLSQQGYGIVDASGKPGVEQVQLLDILSQFTQTFNQPQYQHEPSHNRYYDSATIRLIDDYTLQELDLTLSNVDQQLDRQESIILVVVPHSKSIGSIKKWLERKLSEGIALSPIGHHLKQPKTYSTDRK